MRIEIMKWKLITLINETNLVQISKKKKKIKIIIPFNLICFLGQL
jgi:hypothetical protein